MQFFGDLPLRGLRNFLMVPNGIETLGLIQNLGPCFVLRQSHPGLVSYICNTFGRHNQIPQKNSVKYFVNG